MANVFRNFSKRMENSYWALLIFILAVFLFYISVNLFIEDYATSKAAYEMFPTRKVNDSIVGLAAFLPQLLPLFFGYLFLADTDKRMYGILSVLIMGLDMFTDVYYKSYGLNTTWTIVAMLESFFLYTVGSEILLVATIGTIAALFRPAITQFVRLMTASIDMVKEIAEELGGIGKSDSHSYNNTTTNPPGVQGGRPNPPGFPK